MTSGGDHSLNNPNSNHRHHLEEVFQVVEVEVEAEVAFQVEVEVEVEDHK